MQIDKLVSLIGLFLPIILVLTLAIKKDELQINHSFYLNQTWTCYDILSILVFDSIIRVIISILVYNKAIIPSFMVYHARLPYLILIGLFSYIIVRFKCQKSIIALGLDFRRCIPDIVLGLSMTLGYGFILFLGRSFLTGVNGSQETYDPVVIEGSLARLVHITVLAIIGPVIEESVYRGLMYSPIRRKIGDKGSVFLTSLIWAVGHQGLRRVVISFVIGIFYAYLYKKSRSIVPSAIAHAVHNVIMYLLKGYR